MEKENVVSLEDRIPKLKQRRKKKANRRAIALLSVFFLLLIFVLYFLSPLSNVKKINVKGNVYTSENIIVETSGLSTDTTIWKVDKEEIKETLEMVYKRFPRLKERKNQLAGTLSGGEQQMLAMGRALMSKPKIILMDEPSMGLSPIFVNEIFDIIREVSEAGTTVLLVEQNAKKALSIADRAYVLETGKIVLEGDAKELMNDESVKKAYLGE